MSDLAQAMVEHFEGCRLQSYLDTRGVPTIGWGHTGPDVFYPGQTCTQAEADEWLGEDMLAARADATYFPGYGSLNDVRQAVLISMCFQMGKAPLHWPDFNSALAMSDFKAAAAAGLDSEWARVQTPSRATAEMSMLETGNWELT